MREDEPLDVTGSPLALSGLCQLVLVTDEVGGMVDRVTHAYP
jgi:hypothetical protein